MPTSNTRERPRNLVLGWLVALLGLIPAYALIVALEQNTDVLWALFRRPFTTAPNFCLALFPVVWAISFSSEFRRLQGRIALCGGLLVLLCLGPLVERINRKQSDVNETRTSKPTAVNNAASTHSPSEASEIVSTRTLSERPVQPPQVRFSNLTWYRHERSIIACLEFDVTNLGSQELSDVRVVVSFKNETGVVVSKMELSKENFIEPDIWKAFHPNSISPGKTAHFRRLAHCPLDAQTCSIQLGGKP